MKRKLFLTAAAVLCVLNLTACGRRDEPGARYPETTAAPTVRETVRTEEKTHSRVGEDISEIASDAAHGAGELMSEAASAGRELMTDAASDVSDAVDRRRGDGDHHADDDGRVHENGTAASER